MMTVKAEMQTCTNWKRTNERDRRNFECARSCSLFTYIWLLSLALLRAVHSTAICLCRFSVVCFSYFFSASASCRRIVHAFRCALCFRFNVRPQAIRRNISSIFRKYSTENSQFNKNGQWIAFYAPFRPGQASKNEVEHEKGKSMKQFFFICFDVCLGSCACVFSCISYYLQLYWLASRPRF